MLQNLAHEGFVDLGGCNKTVHLWRVVQLFEGSEDVGVGGRRFQTGFVELVLAVDDHLRPTVDRNSGNTAVDRSHLDGT